MAIAVSCPACEHEVRVKDELAGRKIRCPKCQGAVSVPSPAETRTAAKAPAKASTRKPAEKEEEEVDRPRKKKKRRTTSNKGLWIGLGAGGAVVLGAVITGVVLIAHRKPPEPPPMAQQPPPPKRIVGREEDEAGLKALWTAYRSFCDRERKGPENLMEIEPELKNHPKILKLLAEGKVTCQYGVVPDKLEHQNKALAYDTNPDANGLRFVLMGDQRVVQMDVGQFEKTQKIVGDVAAVDPARPVKPKVGGIPRFKDKLEAEQTLRSVVLAYRNFHEQKGQPPTKLEELEPYYERSARVTEAIKAGTLKVVWNQRIVDSGEILIAFEADADASNRRVVATANGGVRTATEFEFQEMLKNVPK
jgi:hypothetical protein